MSCDISGNHPAPPIDGAPILGRVNGVKNNALPRLDTDSEWRNRLLPSCRIRRGEIWQDPHGKHRVACLDATDVEAVSELTTGSQPTLAVHDPPYNLVAFETRATNDYIDWCRRWVKSTHHVLAENASFYVWLGADQS